MFRLRRVAAERWTGKTSERFCAGPIGQTWTTKRPGAAPAHFTSLGDEKTRLARSLHAKRLANWIRHAAPRPGPNPALPTDPHENTFFEWKKNGLYSAWRRDAVNPALCRAFYRGTDETVGVRHRWLTASTFHFFFRRSHFFGGNQGYNLLRMRDTNFWTCSCAVLLKLQFYTSCVLSIVEKRSEVKGMQPNLA